MTRDRSVLYAQQLDSVVSIRQNNIQYPYHAWLEVDTNAIIHNYREIRLRLSPQTKILAVLKADAYGMGGISVSKVLEKEGVDCIGVALVPEARVLREAGIGRRIFLMSPPFEWEIREVVNLNLEVIVPDIRVAHALSNEAIRQAKKVKVHIKVDTGMHRLGILPEELPQLLSEIEKMQGIEVIGLYTHFSRADEEDQSNTIASLKAFEINVDYETEDFAKKRHVANSAVILNPPFPKLHKEMDLVRPGILLYGYSPSMELDKMAGRFKPAVSLKSRIIQVKRISSEVTIGYGGTYKTPYSGFIAVASIGYGDGYPRQMSNKGEVLIGGRHFQISGRVCMDHVMVFCGEYQPEYGDEVVLLGSQGNEEVTMFDWVSWLDTIPHEILCCFSPRLPRVYV